MERDGNLDMDKRKKIKKNKEALGSEQAIDVKPNKQDYFIHSYNCLNRDFRILSPKFPPVQMIGQDVLVSYG